MAWMLPGGQRAPVPVGDADRFVNTVIHQRVSGLVLEAFDQGALAGAPDDIRARLVEAHLAALRSSLAAEAASVDGVGTLPLGRHPPRRLEGVRHRPARLPGSGACGSPATSTC